MSQRAFASVIGAFISDSVGSFLEFQQYVSDKEVKEALKMPGGGPHNVGPGQITDDSELAICLAKGLLAGGFDEVAKCYIKWIKSRPFDVGNTCLTAFSVESVKDHQDVLMAKNARKFNIKSKANGAAMRITPAIVYGHNLSDDKLVKLVKADAMLSHPNKTVQDCNACYALAIRYLFTHPEDNIGAYEVACKWAEENAVDEVKSWLKDCKTDDDIDCTNMQGFVKWGFMLSFYHLYKKSTFVEALADTIKRGGDTDSNAAIVGGLVAPVWGEKKIPKYMRDKVLNYNYIRCGGQKRPDWLSAGGLRDLCDSLWKAGENIS